jgi:hypothetical protein
MFLKGKKKECKGCRSKRVDSNHFPCSHCNRIQPKTADYYRKEDNLYLEEEEDPVKALIRKKKDGLKDD